MAFDIVEVSNRTTVLAKDIVENGEVVEEKENWTRVDFITDIQYKAKLGESSTLTITVSNINNRNDLRHFRAYQRIRVLEQRTYVPFFLGRIKKLSPNFAKGTLSIICQDYMSDLERK